MTQKKEITKKDIFELGQHIMKVGYIEFSVAVMELTALLNQKKDDSYYIPKALFDSFNSAANYIKKEETPLEVSRVEAGNNFISSVKVLNTKLKELESKGHPFLSKDTIIRALRDKVLSTKGGNKENPHPECRSCFFLSKGVALINEGLRDASALGFTEKLMHMNQVIEGRSH